jgi:hypothetical protein
MGSPVIAIAGGDMKNLSLLKVDSHISLSHPAR